MYIFIQAFIILGGVHNTINTIIFIHPFYLSIYVKYIKVKYCCKSLKCKECCDIIQGSDIYICDPEEIT